MWRWVSRMRGEMEWKMVELRGQKRRESEEREEKVGRKVDRPYLFYPLIKILIVISNMR